MRPTPRQIALLLALVLPRTAAAQCGGDDFFEPNDDCASAVYVENDATGLTVAMDDADWYRMRVPPQELLQVDVLFSHAIANVDVRLWDACGGQLVSWSNSVDDDEVVYGINFSDEPVDFFCEVYVNPASSGDCNDYEMVIDGAGTNLGANYCQASTNSTGQPALMSAEGSLSVAENDLVLYARTMPPHQFGIFYYGPQQLEIAFGNGYRCVGPGDLGLFLLLPPDRSNSFGELSCPLDLTAPPDAKGQILPGSTWYFQAFFRDPIAGGYRFDFSDGLALAFAP